MVNPQQPQSPTPDLKPNEVQAFKNGQLNLNWRDYLPLGPDGQPIKFDDVPACCTCIREELAEMEGIETDGNGQRVKRGLLSRLFGGKPSTNQGSIGGGRVDWETLHRAIPWIAVGMGGLMWLAFLVIPTITGAHYAGMFPAISNYAYVAMGLTLFLAGFVAAKAQHGLRAIAFTFSLLLLSYWF